MKGSMAWGPRQSLHPATGQSMPLSQSVGTVVARSAQCRCRRQPSDPRNTSVELIENTHSDLIVAISILARQITPVLGTQVIRQQITDAPRPVIRRIRIAAYPSLSGRRVPFAARSRLAGIHRYNLHIQIFGSCCRQSRFDRDRDLAGESMPAVPFAKVAGTFTIAFPSRFSRNLVLASPRSRPSSLTQISP
ncbi:hypothetical protein K239x_37160 [Planctomycetes bacterium K23_9]|uniref:Uncharacterized protein n=1 Tax=Stieleria marina TaxID=1930275 RepID=A0A517NXA3_9BACT|nr:hypothetical protein K239x_37160 [Planctomycetes bacterium K23_9]